MIKRSLADLSALPRPLAVGVAMTVLQAVVILVMTVEQVFSFRSERAELALSNVAVFLLWALMLGGCAWGLARLNSVARAPLVTVQVLQLLIAWEFVTGPASTVWLGGAIAVSVVVVLVGVLHPASTEALARAER